MYFGIPDMYLISLNNSKFSVECIAQGMNSIAQVMIHRDLRKMHLWMIQTHDTMNIKQGVNRFAMEISMII